MNFKVIDAMEDKEEFKELCPYCESKMIYNKKEDIAECTVCEFWGELLKTPN